jgi:hypothetical protein
MKADASRGRGLSQNIQSQHKKHHFAEYGRNNENTKALSVDKRIARAPRSALSGSEPVEISGKFYILTEEWRICGLLNDISGIQ